MCLTAVWIEQVYELKSYMIAVLFSLFAISAWVQDAPKTVSYNGLLQKPLAKLNLHPSDVFIDPDRIEFSSSVQLSPLHKLFIKEPLEAHHYNQILSHYLADYPPTFFAGFFVNLSILCNTRIDFDYSRKWDTTIPSKENFVETFFKTERLLKDKVTKSQQTKWQQNYSEMTDTERIIVYELMKAISRAWPWLEVARKSIPQNVDLTSIEKYYNADDISPSNLKRLEQFHKNYDQRALYLASAEMAHFLTLLLSKMDEKSLEISETIQLSSSFGPIVISGASTENEYDFHSPPLFLLDLHGDDTYKGNYSIANATVPFSITVDMNGSDQYSSEQPLNGAGSSSFGVSSLLDLGEGDDTYTGKSQCFGYSFAGASLVYDASGTSNYTIDSHGLGASDWGISMLIDSEGSDTYRSYYKSQGSGSMNGLGLLLDLEGNDEYIAEATPVKFPSPQLPEQNFSASQGFGSGRFGPFKEGYSFQGGMGILVDRRGNDVYKASVFAQGAGYGFGIGFFSDLDGHDQYHNSWYALGSAAHQACGLAYDATGNDTVNTSHYMAGGAATDLSLGLFVDSSGDDQYEALNASFGYSLKNSIAMMLELNGDDQYTLHNGKGMGVAFNENKKSFRAGWPTFGFFVDFAGIDEFLNVEIKSFDFKKQAENQVPHSTRENEYQLGLDIENFQEGQ